MVDESRLANIQTIVFDYDGTLHDSTANYIVAFKRAYEFLVERRQAVPRVWKDDEITKWLGYSSKDMWRNFMPNLSLEYQTQASKIIGDTLLEKVVSYEANLYPQALETMEYLKNKGYRLVFLSNCSEDYLNAHRKVFRLSDYFDDLFCTESFGYIPKYAIFDEIRQRYPAEFLIVGDRSHDFEIGLHHQLLTVGCNYGFGTDKELKQADVRIDAIRDLQDLL